MRRLTIGAVLPAAVAASIAFAAVGCATLVEAKDYGHHGAMGYGPLTPFDQTVPVNRVPKFQCKDGKCIVPQELLAEVLKEAYEEGKNDQQAICGART